MTERKVFRVNKIYLVRYVEYFFENGNFLDKLKAPLVKGILLS